MMSQTTYMVPLEGRHQRRARRFGTQQGRHHGERLHATDRGGREVDARCDLLGADGKGGGSGRLVKIGKKFGTVWYGGNFGRPASDRIKRIGA